ncbi:MAG: hypothetical protein V4694_06730 [Pseudomonadota bacterium]
MSRGNFTELPNVDLEANRTSSPKLYKPVKTSEGIFGNVTAVVVGAALGIFAFVKAAASTTAISQGLLYTAGGIGAALAIKKGLPLIKYAIKNRDTARKVFITGTNNSEPDLSPDLINLVSNTLTNQREFPASNCNKIFNHIVKYGPSLSNQDLSDIVNDMFSNDGRSRSLETQLGREINFFRIRFTNDSLKLNLSAAPETSIENKLMIQAISYALIYNKISSLALPNINPETFRKDCKTIIQGVTDSLPNKEQAKFATISLMLADFLDNGNVKSSVAQLNSKRNIGKVQEFKEDEVINIILDRDIETGASFAPNFSEPLSDKKTTSKSR